MVDRHEPFLGLFLLLPSHFAVPDDLREDLVSSRHVARGVRYTIGTKEELILARTDLNHGVCL